MAPGVAKTFIKELYKIMCIRYPECSHKESTVDKYNKYLDNEGIKNELKQFRKERRLILNKLNEVEEIIQAKYVRTLNNSEIRTLIDLALKYTEDATHQAMEAVVHNLNSMHSRAGAQVPFSSLNFGTDTSPEGRMVMKQFLLATEEGLGSGETPIFPISIFKLKSGVNYNPEDPNYDLFKLACKVSAKRLFPE